MRWIDRAFIWTALATLPVAAQQPPAAPSVRYVAVLDPAHGGTDAGGRLASGQLEKTAALTLAVRLRSLLMARGISVVSTHESDITLDPNRRAAIANHAKAQLCLILHASESGSGVHLFVSSLAPAQPVLFPPWKTAQAAWVPRSLALAGSLNSAVGQAGLNVALGRTSLPGLDSMTCPAVAVELAPLRAQDGTVTAEPDDASYQAKVAAALAAAVLAFRSEPRQP
ncbi:MAG: N-acetylmuramoyl-L-alanine amidase [Terracidiphilus sp.]